MSIVRIDEQQNYKGPQEHTEFDMREPVFAKRYLVNTRIYQVVSVSPEDPQLMQVVERLRTSKYALSGWGEVGIDEEDMDPSRHVTFLVGEIKPNDTGGIFTPTATMRASFSTKETKSDGLAFMIGDNGEDPLTLIARDLDIPDLSTNQVLEVTRLASDHESMNELATFLPILVKSMTELARQRGTKAFTIMVRPSLARSLSMAVGYNFAKVSTRLNRESAEVRKTMAAYFRYFTEKTTMRRRLAHYNIPQEKVSSILQDPDNFALLLNGTKDGPYVVADGPSLYTATVDQVEYDTGVIMGTISPNGRRRRNPQIIDITKETRTVTKARPYSEDSVKRHAIPARIRLAHRLGLV